MAQVLGIDNLLIEEYNMRAKEFITEIKLHGTWGQVEKNVSDALPGAFVQRDLRNTDPYMQYRYMLALAGARAKAEDGVEFDQESAWAENFAVVTYTPEDEETIRLADAMMGVTATRIASPNSKETDVDTKSPVPARKKNKYGV
jgi:hypothetical protein